MKKLFGLLLSLAVVASAGYPRPTSSPSPKTSYSPPKVSYSPPKVSAPARPSYPTSKPSNTVGYNTPKYNAPKYNAPTPQRIVTPTPRPVYTPPVNQNVTKSPYVNNSQVRTQNSYPVNNPTSARVTTNPTVSNRYSSYNRPISRTPNWYRSGYSYHFSNSRYNSGYSYYPIMCDPWHGTLSAMLAGALVTHMILDNGHRQPIYADGYGSAYTVVNGQQIEVAQDDNGNWVQLNPTQSASVSYEQPAPQVVQPVVAPAPVVVVKKNGWGFWAWFGLISFLAILTILGISLYQRSKGEGW